MVQMRFQTVSIPASSSCPIFGFTVAFTEEQKTSAASSATKLKRAACCAFGISACRKTCRDTLWHGYARRYINAYVPHFSEVDEWPCNKYAPVKDAGRCRRSARKQPENLQPSGLRRTTHGKRRHFAAKSAIAALKGDVDNLGNIFQQGLSEPTFAKMAALSRQMNHFFSLWLPAYCANVIQHLHCICRRRRLFPYRPVAANPKAGCRYAHALC